jgi:uncharacterized protein
MAEEQLRIVIDEKRAVTAIRTAPEGRSAGVTFVYAPGAGSNVHDPFGRYACRELAAHGVAAVRLQFPYMEDRRRAPDPTPVLEATWRAAIEQLSAPDEKLVVGGRSMGGRIASHVVAQGERVDALTVFAYPLHAPGKPDQWRDAHLPSITVPVLFCSGTRDAFATPDELRSVTAKMKRATVHELGGADHGYAVPAASGRKREDVWCEAVEVTLAWLQKQRILK